MPQFMSGPDQSLGRKISGGWMWGCDLGRSLAVHYLAPELSLSPHVCNPRVSVFSTGEIPAGL